MQQYKQLLQAIKDRGTHKPAARQNMPGTISLFGYQFRHNLSDGFPLLTTKKVSFKAIVVELLWFLRGDTNIRYLIENGVNIWNEDAYNYYLKMCKEKYVSSPFNFKDFIDVVKKTKFIDFRAEINKTIPQGYTIGDCGFQYGRVWRNWIKPVLAEDEDSGEKFTAVIDIDQISNLIASIKNNPESRRHIVTAIDPAHDKELALYWCHAMFQFNCRPIQYFEGDGKVYGQKGHFYYWITKPHFTNPPHLLQFQLEEVEATSIEEIKNNPKYPTYFLDCQLYQRSADVFLGVPFNIASYALLTHIIAGICNMLPGEFIHTFGDVHIYDNHTDAVDLQLSRKPLPLPKLNDFGLNFSTGLEMLNNGNWDVDRFIKGLFPTDFTISNYNSHPAIKATLSTGLTK